MILDITTATKSDYLKFAMNQLVDATKNLIEAAGEKNTEIVVAYSAIAEAQCATGQLALAIAKEMRE